jgi:hypothetical protein
MGWQDAGVAAVFLGAIVFLARKFFVRPKTKSTTAFVPLSSLKKKP